MFRYGYDVQSAMEPWRDKLGDDFENVIARLSDRDRQLEDYLSKTLPQGVLGRTEVTSGASSAVSVTVASVDVVVPAGRTVKVTGAFRQHTHSVVNGRTLVSIYEDGVLRSTLLVIGHPTVAGNATMGATVEWPGSPAAGEHTYELRLVPADAGTVSFFAAATSPAFILVEDIGPA